LLAVAINAAIRRVDFAAALRHAGFRHRINIGLFFVRLRIKMADLPIRNQHQARPLKGERTEDAEEESGHAFHM